MFLSPELGGQPGWRWEAQVVGEHEADEDAEGEEVVKSAEDRDGERSPGRHDGASPEGRKGGGLS